MREAFDSIYHATNLMLSELGAAGEISTRNTLVTDLMDALYDYDNGVYDCKLLNKLTKAEATIKAVRNIKSRTFKSANSIPVGLPANELWIKASDLDKALDSHA